MVGVSRVVSQSFNKSDDRGGSVVVHFGCHVMSCLSFVATNNFTRERASVRRERAREHAPALG